MTYICKSCGKTHEDLPALGFNSPDYADLVPVSERRKRVKLDDELCAVDDEYFFIRASLSIPIHDFKDDLNFGVWVSQSKENFLSYVEHFNSAEIGPYFGWLANDLKFRDESTVNMKTMVHFQDGSMRPRVELNESDHPLYVVYRDGISLDEAWEIVHVMLPTYN